MLTRGPYLQQESDRGVVIRWRTRDVRSGVVRYGESPQHLDRVACEAQPSLDHGVWLGGLPAGSRWYYNVGDESGVLAGGDESHQFTLSPPRGKAVDTRIWVLGDPGSANRHQYAVRDSFYQFTGQRGCDLILMLGDNAYEEGTDKQYQAAVFDAYAKVLPSVPLWPALGNHDTAQRTEYHDHYPYFDIFTLPTRGEVGGVPSGTEHYYSFDRGNIHFVCLDSMTADRSAKGPMATWLRKDLAANQSTWLIAYWHHAPFSKGSHDSDKEVELMEMRQNFLPMLEDAGVDLLLFGHSHAYERSFLLDGHYGKSDTLTPEMKKDGGNGRAEESGAYVKSLGKGKGHQGAVYVVAGSAGKTSGGSLDHPAMVVSLNQLGSLVVDVSGNRLDATFVHPTIEGFITPDRFSLIHQP